MTNSCYFLHWFLPNHPTAQLCLSELKHLLFSPSCNNAIWHLITVFIMFIIRLSYCISEKVHNRLLCKETACLVASLSLALKRDRLCGERKWYQLSKGLPVALGNTAGTNGPSSKLAEGIVSESSSAGDYCCLSCKQLMLPRPTTKVVQCVRLCPSIRLVLVQNICF